MPSAVKLPIVSSPLPATVLHVPLMALINVRNQVARSALATNANADVMFVRRRGRRRALPTRPRSHAGALRSVAFCINPSFNWVLIAAPAPFVPPVDLSIV